MAGGGSHGTDQRSLAITGAESHAGAVSVSYSRLPFRQRQRVHQSHRGSVAEQVIGRADQVQAAPFQRRRKWVNQERSRDPQAHGLWAYRCLARGKDRVFLSAVLQHLSELSSSMRCTRAGGYNQGQREASLPLVCHAVGDPTAIAVTGQPPENRRDHRRARSPGSGKNGYTGGDGDARSQAKAIRIDPAEQDRMNEQRLWKCRSVDQEENQNQVSLLAHRPWKSLRDSHIPTASATTADGKVEIQNQDSHFPTATSVLQLNQKGDLARIASLPAFRLIVR